MSKIKSAGFVVVQEGYAISGTGKTKDEAIEDAKEWTSGDIAGLDIHPATQALIDLVDSEGGLYITWEYIDGVACTKQEAESLESVE
ncbi:hypothetical protein PT300_13375 [Enterobacteriaceae bacterium ESL0689]|nr:hypothetical protein [Enterobacteriaceae bacterium ESL0689]